MRCVALLRAVNVGGHLVKMERLRALVAELGFGNVETFIASGNVIFDATRAQAARAERAIEQALEGEFGYEVPAFVRTVEDIAGVAALEPFDAADVARASTFCVAFLKAAPDAAHVRSLMDLRSDDHDFHVNGREVFWLSRLKQSDPAFSKMRIERVLGVAMTVRGISTVRKLAARYPPPPSAGKARG